MACKKTTLMVSISYVLLKCLSFVTNLISSITRFFIKSKKGCLPPVNNQLLLLDAQTLTKSIKKLEIKCEDVVQAYIDRINMVNPLINALTDQRFDEALEEARQIDINIKYEVKNGSPSLGQQSLLNKPLLGVPVTAKNSVFVKNLLTDCGMVKRKGVRASENAVVVENLNKAGAILLGLTNIPELLIWYDSNNKVHGTTKNPYDLSRIPGGSSGGEGALISSAGSLCGIGSDIAGSIRMPSFFCGIWGHFPTPGIISNEGMYPPACEGWNNHFSFGPICRYASDILPLLKGMAGDNVQKLALDEPVDFSKLVIYHIENDGGSPLSSAVHPEIQTCMTKAVEHFNTKYNTTVKKISYKRLRFTLLIWSAFIYSNGSYPLVVEAELRKGRMNPFLEILKYLLLLSNHTLPIILLGFLDVLTPKKGSWYNQMLIKEGDKIRNFFLSTLGEHGVVFYPTHPIPAVEHKTTIFHGSNCQYTMLSNLIGFPSTHCPMGLTKDKLPIGFQVISTPFNDRYTIAMANELSNVFGGCRPPYDIDC